MFSLDFQFSIVWQDDAMCTCMWDLMAWYSGSRNEKSMWRYSYRNSSIVIP
jgi:hypothetical protein